MNDPSQHETDDELLSAYLDDELSAEERTLVESRLATDPAARQTLEQLRNVSQSVRDLPTESIGHDLRESILRRATASRGVPAPEIQPPHNQPATRSQPGSHLPAVTIGRTMRGWVWASVAIAAAVLIMVLQPGDERNAGLPDIAQNNKPSTESVAPINQHVAESRPADGPAEGQPAPAMSDSEPLAPAAPDVASHGFAVNGQAPVASEPASDAASISDQFEPDTVALQSQAEAARDKVAAMASPAAKQRAAGVAGANPQPVVVRVLARRAAVDNNAFEALLRKHNVEVEPSVKKFATEETWAARAPSTDTADTAADVESQPVDASSNVKNERELEENAIEAKGRIPAARADQPGAQENGNVELVWVDAPSSTIFSCMNELNNDADNYLGISVDHAPKSNEDQAAAISEEAKNASELVRFNRGTVLLPRKHLAEEDFYFKSLENDVAQQQLQQQYFAKDRRFRGGEKLEESALGNNSTSDRGSARRLLLRFDDESGKRVSSSIGGGVGGKLSAIDAKHKEGKEARAANQPAVPPAPDRDRMQVLFVIRPSDEPAPSLKAKNRAE